MNLMLIIVLLFLVVKIVDGYKKGMVKEVISFVSLIVMCVVVVLIGAGLHSYMEKKIIGVIIAIFLLSILGIAHHLLGVVFLAGKLIVKLPIISWVDKLLGMVAGALEVILVLWTLYTFTMHFGLGAIGQKIVECTQQSKLLSLIYEYNMLAPIVESVLEKLPKS